MSNNEIFQTIFQDIAYKLIDKYLTKISIVKNDKTGYLYSSNLQVNNIVNVLKSNINNIVSKLSDKLEINDKEAGGVEIKLILE